MAKTTLSGGGVANALVPSTSRDQSRPDLKSDPLTGEHLVFTKGPSAPTDLTAVIVSTRFITLSWRRPATASDNIQGYSVVYKQAGSDR